MMTIHGEPPPLTPLQPAAAARTAAVAVAGVVTRALHLPDTGAVAPLLPETTTILTNTTHLRAALHDLVLLLPLPRDLTDIPLVLPLTGIRFSRDLQDMQFP
jgi:hypothetical protein